MNDDRRPVRHFAETVNLQRPGFSQPKLQQNKEPREIQQASIIEDFEPVYEEEKFVDVKNELSQASKRVLGLVKQDGFEISVRPDRIVIKREEFEKSLFSNSDVREFAETLGF